MAFTIKDGVLLKYAEQEQAAEVTVPEGVTEIGREAFRFCKGIIRITLPDGLRSIGSWAFAGCTELVSINIPDSVESIGDKTFYNCSQLKRIILPDRITQIGEVMFASCNNLCSVRLPANLKRIGAYAFWCCWELPEISLPAGLESIEKNAFVNCTSLTELVLPPSVNRIGANAFHMTNALRRFVFQGIALDTEKLDEAWKKEPSVTDEQNFDQWDAFFSMLESGDFTVEFPAFFMPFKHLGITGFFLRTGDAKAADYVKTNICAIVSLLIEHQNTEIIYDLLERKLITNDTIDDLIDAVIKLEQLEIQTLLLRYKSEVLGYTDPKVMFRL